jgi:uncharacterized membrane protein
VALDRPRRRDHDVDTISKVGILPMPFTNFLLEFIVIFIYVGIPLLLLKVLLRAAFGHRDDSGKLLRRRFAKGEISQVEFEDAKRILGI